MKDLPSLIGENKNMTTERKNNLESLKTLIYDLFILEDIKCEVVIDNTDVVNARVEYFSGEYIVRIYSGLINNIQNLIHDKLSSFDDNDRKWFQNFQYLDFLKIFDFNTPESEKERVLYDLKNLFASSIFLAVIFHEMGHVVANHLGENSLYSEFSSNGNGNLDCQEKEMVADWLSIKKFFSLIFSNLEQVEMLETSDDGYGEKFMSLLRRSMIFTWLVFALEFHLQDMQYVLSPENIDKLKSKKHPPNEVRFYYCTEAMSEAVMDILNTKFGMNDEQSGFFYKTIFKDVKVYVQSFIRSMSLSFSDLYDSPLIYEYYIILRDVPYKGINQDGFLHLQKLTKEQLEVLNNLIDYFKKGNKID